MGSGASLPSIDLETAKVIYGDQFDQKRFDQLKDTSTGAVILDNLTKFLATASAATPEEGTEMKAEQIQSMREHPSLGIIRLDYDSEFAPGEIDCKDSFNYDVYYRSVPGLTFEMCQEGKMDEKVEGNFINAVKYLDETRGCDVITGDCGFMMYFQELARKHTKKAVCMSSLASLPAIACQYQENEKIAIFTANSITFEPLKEKAKQFLNVDCQYKQFVTVGCEKVKGFEAVKFAKKVPYDVVLPGIIEKAKQICKEHPTVRAILMECTQLPPFSDGVRAALPGIAVYDVMTTANAAMAGFLDNPLFGKNNFYKKFDHIQEDYFLGRNLETGEEKDMLRNGPLGKDDKNAVTGTDEPKPVSDNFDKQTFPNAKLNADAIASDE